MDIENGLEELEKDYKQHRRTAVVDEDENIIIYVYSEFRKQEIIDYVRGLEARVDELQDDTYLRDIISGMARDMAAQAERIKELEKRIEVKKTIKNTGCTNCRHVLVDENLFDPCYSCFNYSRWEAEDATPTED